MLAESPREPICSARQSSGSETLEKQLRDALAREGSADFVRFPLWVSSLYNERVNITLDWTLLYGQFI